MITSGKPGACTTPADIGTLLPTLEAIRTNCHISDAQFATNYTLCVYLLKMREYFRWEHDLPFGAALPHDELTDWLTRREAHWDSLEDARFEHVPVGNTRYDPFDAGALNAALNPLGYVYSSGFGPGMKPVFFLGTLETYRRHEDYRLLVSGQELARDLAAPPAMSLDGTIFIRRESLRRMLWERLEEWRWNRPANAMEQALACYDFDNAPDASLEAMTDDTLNTALLHEIGEVQAGKRLGDAWEDMLETFGHSKVEVMLRAVRDHLADALSTLPGLLAENRAATLHGYIGSLSNMRKELSPRLLAAYGIWTVTGSTRELEMLCMQAQEHWSTLAHQLLGLFRAHGAEARQQLVTAIETHTF